MNIPFVFLSTSMEADLVAKAGSLLVQGFYKKPNNTANLRDIAKAIALSLPGPSIAKTLNNN